MTDPVPLVAAVSETSRTTPADRLLHTVPAGLDDFTAFVQARTPSLLRAAYLLTGDQQHAEDLVQSALARTHRRWSRLHAVGNADAYVRKTMYHLRVAWWRRSRVPESLAAQPPEPHPSGYTDGAEASVLRLALRDALLNLPVRQRAVLVLRFFEDRSEAETAELLGIQVGTVKSQTARALAKLRSIAPELGRPDDGTGATGSGDEGVRK